jgi:hypothetical protein
VKNKREKATYMLKEERAKEWKGELKRQRMNKEQII